ncbi:ABC transporter ATP-binding protein [Oceanobacillus halotolerans]|uniref:ABC transporter ATP-binding protein n=1 Tax=Oceanobacillus halotolerans TaxID=2663380 RepID=UPI0013DB59E2|nr:ABC transporter ATP-binding protein [Oceanobacillus halotolerans]
MIKVVDTTQKYRFQVIYEQANFAIEKGERVAIIGKNGAGKTTLLHNIVGLNRPKKGMITINGKEVHRPAAWSGKLSYLPEKFQLYTQLSVEENVQYVADTLKLPKHEVEHVLRHTNMWEHKAKQMNQLSKGMRQRVGLSVALLGKPEWLILDEPTSGLDPFGRMDVLQLMKKMGTADRTLLFTTHHMNEVKELATAVLFMHDKQISKMAVEDFFAQYEGSFFE